jgi:TetR/AcrR family transcriptional regulator
MARPRADDYFEKRQMFLERAAELFAKKGFAGTSISTIAEYCSSSKALLYHYYPSKETMLFDMLQSHCQLLLQSAGEVLNSAGTPAEKLRNLLRTFMTIYVTSHAKHAVMLNDLHWLSGTQQSEIKELERKIVGVFRQLVREVRPDLSADLANAVAMSLMGSINWTYIWFKPGGKLTAEGFADVTADLFFEGINSLDAASTDGIPPAIVFAKSVKAKPFHS